MQQEKIKQKRTTTNAMRRATDKIGDTSLEKNSKGAKELRKATVPVKAKRTLSPSSSSQNTLANSPQQKGSRSTKHVVGTKMDTIQKSRTPNITSTISQSKPNRVLQSEDRFKVRPSIKQSPRKLSHEISTTSTTRNGVSIKRSVSKVKNKVMDVTTNVTVQSPISSPNATPKKVKTNIKNTVLEQNIKPAVSPPLAFEIDLAKNGRVRTQTRTLDPSEIKFKGETTSDADNIEQTNIPTCDVNTKSRKMNTAFEINLNTNEISNISKTDDKDDDCDYEDDFESYESDFESFNSSESEAESEQKSKSLESSFHESIDLEMTDDKSEEKEISDTFKELKLTEKNINSEEERKLDSGNYDLRQKYPKTIHLSNKPEDSNRKKSLTEIATDEGFVEQINKQLTETDNFIDFSHMKNKIKSQSAKAKVNKRGKEILEKLTLDTMSFTILDMQPLTYNDYMNVYGNADCVQISSQTKEDNLSVEIQTEDVGKENKWTQHPVSYAKYIQEDETINYKTLCVGDDNINKQECINTEINTNELNIFLEYTSKQMLLYLDEISKPKMKHNKQDISFSDCHYKINCTHSYLSNMSITKLCYFNKYNMLLSVHVRNIKDNISAVNTASMDAADYDMPVRQYNHRSIICGWHINNQMEPFKILATWGEVTSVSFGGDAENIVIAGMRDGSLACWDLEEPSCYHGTDDEHVFRAPSHFIVENTGSYGPIVDILPLRSNYDKNEISAQICTLNENGLVKIWTIVQTKGSQNVAIDPGLSFWSKIRLVNSHTIQLKRPKSKRGPNNEFNTDNSMNVMRCTSFTVDSVDPRIIYVIITDLNYIIGCFVNWDDRFKYYNTKADIPISITQNPYYRPWFAVACVNSIQIFNRGMLQPMHVVPLFADNPSVKDLGPDIHKGFNNICWSPSNPQIIFICDNKRIFTVDIISLKVLNKSNFDQNVFDMRIYQKHDKDYIVLNYDKQIEVHKISKSFRCKNRRHTEEIIANVTSLLQL